MEQSSKTTFIQNGKFIDIDEISRPRELKGLNGFLLQMLNCEISGSAFDSVKPHWKIIYFKNGANFLARMMGYGIKEVKSFNSQEECIDAINSEIMQSMCPPSVA